MKKQIINLICGILVLFLILFSSFVSALELKVTLEHPFYVNNSWIESKNLQVGDELTTLDGKKVRITKITEMVPTKPVVVYNFHVDGFENYFANNVLVHNKGGAITKALRFFGLAEESLIPGLGQAPLKILIISDIHGRADNVNALKSIIDDADELWVLGDFDTPEAVRAVLSLVESHPGLKLRLVPGNHDKGVIDPVNFGFSKKGEPGSAELSLKFKEDPKYYEYLKAQVEQPEYGKLINYVDNPINPTKGSKIGLAHAGPSTSPKYDDMSELDAGLWNRAESWVYKRSTPDDPDAIRDFKPFFEAMGDDVDVLVRGHDHTPGVVQRKGSNMKLFKNGIQSRFASESGKKTIITTGALQDGRYTLLNIGSSGIKVNFHTLP